MPWRDVRAKFEARRPNEAASSQREAKKPDGVSQHKTKEPGNGWTTDRSEDKAPDGDTMIDGDKDPATNRIDTPTLSAVWSVVPNVTLPNDGGNGIGSVPDNKRKLSISPSSKDKTSRKFSRTAPRQALSNNTEETYQGNSNAYSSSRTYTKTLDATGAAHASSIGDRLKTGREVKFGKSQSALASRKLREGVSSGTYVMREKRFENWKEKITNLDPGARFDTKNPRKVFHSLCSTWFLVKEPGDTTRFKQHVKACPAKPTPAGGTLMGMGWLKVKGSIDTSGDRKDEAKMPCRGVSDVDNPLVNRYLKRTGAGGGGGRSIHVISRERFKEEFKHLTDAQGEVVKVAQRTEWVWRNDHLHLRVYATNCEKFTWSDSLDLSLCSQCKRLLFHTAFAAAIRKKVPLDENLKYTNGQYLNSVLGRLYAQVKGLRAIIDHPVSVVHLSPKPPHSQ